VRVPAAVQSMAFDPGDRRLAVGYLPARPVSVYDLRSGDSVAELPVGAMPKQTVVWHPGGERLAVGGSDARIQL